MTPHGIMSTERTGTASTAPSMVRTFEGGSNVAKSTCAVEGCGRPIQCRDQWCLMHYKRWSRTGDPIGVRAKGRVPMAPHLRVLAQTDTAGDCWVYSGYNPATRYGQVGVGSQSAGTKRHASAHRVMYEALVGPIPDGLELDHTCRNTRCVNPAHLEPVTHSENMRRAFMFRQSAEVA